METRIDIRSISREYAFGYVYVGDTRVGFNIDIGDNGLSVWACRPENVWPTPSSAEFKAAEAALKAEFSL